MKVIETGLQDCWVIEPAVFSDERGYFFESFNERRFSELTGQPVHFVQDNQSFSTKGVLRGLHFQTGEYAQAKLVRVIQGAVLDVAVDIRPGSPTYGKWYAIELSAENKKQLFVPRGFAHGFQVLTDTAEFFYKCDNYYHKAAEGGIHYADPELGILWPGDAIVSDKDKVLPRLITL